MQIYNTDRPSSGKWKMLTAQPTFSQKEKNFLKRATIINAAYPFPVKVGQQPRLLESIRYTIPKYQQQPRNS